MESIKYFFKNHPYYAWITVGFIVYVAFIDSGSLLIQYKNQQKLAEIQAEKQEFELKTLKLKRERKEIFGTTEATEAFAREKYLMKRPQETVFVIVDENDQSIEKVKE